MLLALNRLPASSNNALVKLFASRQQERSAGFASLDSSVFADSTDLHAYVLGLSQTLNVEGDMDMAEVLTPEKVLEYGKRIRELVFETGTPEEKLAGLNPEEKLAGLNPEERLAGLSPDEILAGLNSEERRELLRLLQKEMEADADDRAGKRED